MRERYQEQLGKLQNELVDMGVLCGKAILDTCCLLATAEQRQKRIEEICRIEKEIDGREQMIESICMQLLLRQQPVAGDLRRISAALKMITDLERIGDQAADIAEILQTGSINVPVEGVRISEMAQFAAGMVSKSIEAYVSRDLKLAQETIESDDTLDEMFVEVRHRLEESSLCAFTSDQALDLLMIAKYYERIGDHATNISEWVEFSMTGFHRSGSQPPCNVFAGN